MDRDTLCCSASTACSLCPSNPEPYPSQDLSSLSQGFSPGASSLTFSCASSDPPHFPHLSWVTVGREGAGAGIRSSTQWLEKSSEVRKRECLQLLFFPPLQWTQLWDVNYFVQIGVPVKFCTTTCLLLQADTDQLKQERKKIMYTDKNKEMLTFKRLWS